MARGQERSASHARFSSAQRLERFLPARPLHGSPAPHVFACTSDKYGHHADRVEPGKPTRSHRRHLGQATEAQTPRRTDLRHPTPRHSPHPWKRRPRRFPPGPPTQAFLRRNPRTGGWKTCPVPWHWQPHEDPLKVRPPLPFHPSGLTLADLQLPKPRGTNESPRTREAGPESVGLDRLLRPRPRSGASQRSDPLIRLFRAVAPRRCLQVGRHAESTRVLGRPQ